MGPGRAGVGHGLAQRGLSTVLAHLLALVAIPEAGEDRQQTLCHGERVTILPHGPVWERCCLDGASHGGEDPGSRQ
ncbi:unnamed protein product, partial [Bubo scandiacus]